MFFCLPVELGHLGKKPHTFSLSTGGIDLQVDAEKGWLAAEEFGFVSGVTQFQPVALVEIINLVTEHLASSEQNELPRLA